MILSTRWHNWPEVHNGESDCIRTHKLMHSKCSSIMTALIWTNTWTYNNCVLVRLCYTFWKCYAKNPQTLFTATRKPFTYGEDGDKKKLNKPTQLWTNQFWKKWWQCNRNSLEISIHTKVEASLKFCRNCTLLTSVKAATQSKGNRASETDGMRVKLGAQWLGLGSCLSPTTTSILPNILHLPRVFNDWLQLGGKNYHHTKGYRFINTIS